MPDAVASFLHGRTALDLARDVVDLAIVYYLAYRGLLVLRGTRAMQVGIGLLFVFVLYVASRQLHLVTVESVLGPLFPGAVILILVVVFQNDIRRGLMRMGSQSWLGAGRARQKQAIDEVVEAATELARHRMGAIIAFEQDANLDEFVGLNRGTELDATTSSELLVSLFVPEGVNKLHDGAVIIRDLRVARAGVFFPMPDARALDPSFGSRHRAAVGITEETDAVVVVVSEERGTISFCFNGNIVSNLDGPGLRRALEGVFTPGLARAARARPAGAPTSRRVAEGASPDSAGAARRASEASVPPPRPDALPPGPAADALSTTARIRVVEAVTDAESSPAPLRRAQPDRDADLTAPAPSVTRTQRLPPAVPLRAPGERASNPPPAAEPGEAPASGDGGRPA